MRYYQQMKLTIKLFQRHGYLVHVHANSTENTAVKIDNSALLEFGQGVHLDAYSTLADHNEALKATFLLFDS